MVANFTLYIYIYIHTYILSSTVCFVASQLISVATHTRCSRLGSKSCWFYARRITYCRAVVNLSVSEGIFTNIVILKLIYHDQKIRQTLVRNIRNHWIAVSSLLGLISSIYTDIPDRRSNQRPQNAEPKVYHWAIGPHRTQVMLN